MSKEEKSATITNLKDRTIKVFGNVVHVKTDELALSDDTSKDMAQTPALIAYWGSVKGAAIREEISVDGRYRQWLASQRLKVLEETTKPDKKGVAGKKPNDDTLKAMIEADPQFVKWKDAIGQAADHVAIASVMIIALEKRANVAQSTGATKRVELDKLGATTPVEPKAAKGKRGKAAKADPIPDVEEDDDDEDEDDDDFEADESDEVKNDADDEEEADDDEESDDDDSDDESEDEEADDDDDEEEAPKRRAKKASKKAGKKASKEDDEDDDEEEEDEESEDDDEDEPPPVRRGKKKAKKVGKKKVKRG